MDELSSRKARHFPSRCQRFAEYLRTAEEALGIPTYFTCAFAVPRPISMPCHARVCQRATSRALGPPTTFIWIGDDLCANAFSRFVRASNSACKRYGSNVPGPLEARRRSAKRKMAGLAGSYPGSYDGGFGLPDWGSLLRRNPVKLDWSWLAPRPPEQITPEEATLDTSESPSSVSPKRHSAADTTTDRALTSIANQDPVYLAILFGECTDLKSILELYHREGLVHECQEVALSEVAFARLLDIVGQRTAPGESMMIGDFEQLTQFLQSELNHPDASCTYRLLQWLSERALDVSLKHQFIELVRDKIALGTISLTELKRIVSDLPIFARNCERTESLVQGALTHWCNLIWSAIVSSDDGTPVLAKSGPIMLRLIESLCRANVDITALNLAVDIYCMVPEVHSSMSGNLIGTSLARWARHHVVDVADQNLRDRQMVALHEITKRLAGLEVYGGILSITTQTLLGSIDRDASAETSATSSIVVPWLTCLHHCSESITSPRTREDWIQAHRCVAERFHPSDIADYFKQLTSIDGAYMLLDHWVLPRLEESSATRRLLSQVRVLGSEPVLLPGGIHYQKQGRKPPPDHSARGSPAQVDEYSQSGIATCDLRNTPAIAPHLDLVRKPQPDHSVRGSPARVHEYLRSRIANYDLRNTPTIAPYMDLVKALAETRNPYHYVLDETISLIIHNMEPTNLHKFHYKLSRDPNVSSHFRSNVRSIRHLMKTGNIGFALNVYRKAKNVWPSSYPELIFALLDGGPLTAAQTVKLLRSREIANGLPMALRDRPNNAMSVWKTRLIHLIAWKFANASHITARQAFRRVVNLLHYLRSRGAQLDPLMSRALVHSGVTRPLKENMPLRERKFTWILHHVREIEGERTAELLDRMAFRWNKFLLYGDAGRQRLEEQAQQSEEWVEELRAGLQEKSLVQHRRRMRHLD
ncbi:hypothetical protein M8818_000158 [Zalaria obscura]|uniref:Uncharacterized protein n=1 Tax=Zalaria obscura TaxID=2024903 RepID=A0ACC3SNT2_9PEZI